MGSSRSHAPAQQLLLASLAGGLVADDVVPAIQRLEACRNSWCRTDHALILAADAHGLAEKRRVRAATALGPRSSMLGEVLPPARPELAVAQANGELGPLVVDVATTRRAAVVSEQAGGRRSALPFPTPDGQSDRMIFIVVKWPIKAEYADDWLTHSGDFTAATRAEEGNLFFDWSRSADNPNEWVLVEGFRDGDAGSAHVNSDHFKTATQELGQYLSAVPQVISQEISATNWVDLAEIQPR